MSQAVADLRAPFIWFGGKRRVADVVWDALGDVDNYIEPFAGSLAVLLGRPSGHQGTTETVNDADMFLANFWRALSAAPDEVARWTDWPINEADLFARHLWLVNQGRELLAANIERDPEWFDVKVAGWWVWGLNSWIGSGWCSGTGPWVVDEEGQLPHLNNAGQGVNRQLPHLGDAGQGVNRKRPHLSNAGRGVNRQLPHLNNAGRGVNRKLPYLGNAGQGESLMPVTKGLYEYFQGLAARLRRVRVCCGDWSRVVSGGAMAYGSTVGVFLDPPYSGEVRTKDLYASDGHDVAVDVRNWALANGSSSIHRNGTLRIVLAGYETEHSEEMVAAGWREYAYSAAAAYQTMAQTNGKSGNQANRRLERLWFSPACVERQMGLFG